MRSRFWHRSPSVAEWRGQEALGLLVLPLGAGAYLQVLLGRPARYGVKRQFPLGLCCLFPGPSARESWLLLELSVKICTFGGLSCGLSSANSSRIHRRKRNARDLPPHCSSSPRVPSQPAFLFPPFRVLLWLSVIISRIFSCILREAKGKASLLSPHLGPEVAKQVGYFSTDTRVLPHVKR